MTLIEYTLFQPLADADLHFGEKMRGLFVDSYRDVDPVVHVCFFIIVGCFASAFIVAVLLFAHRFWFQYRDNLRQKLEERYALLLTGIIFDDRDELFEEKRQKLVDYFRKQYVRSPFYKRILRKQLLFLHKNFSGQSQDILKELYYELDLHKSALAQLRDTDWSEKAEAVRELSQMGYDKAKEKILKLTLHENRVLRLEAQAAMLALNEEEPFGFLAYATGEITEWQQLNLEEKAKRLDLKKIPNFSQWFGLKNQSVVEFCVKMTVAYNQFESADALLQLLYSKDERVRLEAVKAVGTMLIDESQLILVEMYPEVSPEMKDAIIVSLGKIGGIEGMVFLEELLLTEEHDFALKAGRALMLIGFDGDAVLQMAAQNEQEQVRSIVKHVLDERI